MRAPSYLLAPPAPLARRIAPMSLMYLGTLIDVYWPLVLMYLGTLLLHYSSYRSMSLLLLYLICRTSCSILLLLLRSLFCCGTAFVPLLPVQHAPSPCSIIAHTHFFSCSRLLLYPPPLALASCSIFLLTPAPYPSPRSPRTHLHGSHDGARPPTLALHMVCRCTRGGGISESIACNLKP